MAGAGQVLIYNDGAHKDEDNKIRVLTKFVNSSVRSTSEESLKKTEEAIMQLGNIYAKRKQIESLQSMIEDSKPTLLVLGKAKAAKLVRNLVDLFLGIEGDNHEHLDTVKMNLCVECIKWATDQNRVFLRQTLEARYIRLLNDISRHQEAQKRAEVLVKELKKLDDKDLIVEVQLEESRAGYHLNNLTKARAALTSARTTANSVYIPPKMQAALDMQSGILHAADERDFKTAFSYFYEAFEGYDSVDMKEEAMRALKYMLLSKIMLHMPDDVQGLLSGKTAIKYSGSHLLAMKAVAAASKKRSLADFQVAFGMYLNELQLDPVVKSHFGSLYEAMLEKNLCRIIEPYSRVQIKQVAEVIGLEKNLVERKLSQMILDKKLSGILDQKEGVLIVLDAYTKDECYDKCILTVHAMGKLVDSLYHKAKKLS